MSDLKGYALAQAAYERQQPDYWNDEGWCECAACNGTGLIGNDTEEECALCAGEGGWDDEGMPISRADYDRRIDREADEYAASRYEDRRDA